MEGAYLKLKRLEAKIKVQADALKLLREQYRDQKLVLYEAMKVKKRTDYKGYQLENLAPKPKVNTKEIRQQKEANIRSLLATSGVHDPGGVLTQIQSIQRPKQKKGATSAV